MVVRWPASAVLVVCADAGTRAMVVDALSRRLRGVELLQADGPEAAWTCLDGTQVEVVVLDGCLDEAAFRDSLRVRWPSVPVVRLDRAVVPGCGGEAGTATDAATDAAADTATGSKTAPEPAPKHSGASEASATLGLAKRFEAWARPRLPFHRRNEMVGPDSSHR